MPQTTQARRARVNAAMGTPPTVAEQTAEREAADAAAIAETKVMRAGRHEARKTSPDWPLQRANFPKDKR